jgi:hypothetical protein
MFKPGPQAGAPANEGAARVGGEPPSFQCPHCDRVLTTASGRELHVKKAHPAEVTTRFPGIRYRDSPGTSRKKSGPGT